MVRLDDVISAHDQYIVAQTKCAIYVDTHFAIIEFNNFIDRVIERRDKYGDKG